MDVNVFVSSRHIDWYMTWPRVHLDLDIDLRLNIKLTFWGHPAYHSKRLEERTRLYSYLFSKSATWGVIRENIKTVIFCFMTPGTSAIDLRPNVVVNASGTRNGVPASFLGICSSWNSFQYSRFSEKKLTFGEFWLSNAWCPILTWL